MSARDDQPVRSAQVSLAEALSKGPPGNLAVPIFAHGSLEVELYTPEERDPQQPHERDEVYVVVRGRGRATCISRGRAAKCRRGYSQRFEAT